MKIIYNLYFSILWGIEKFLSENFFEEILKTIQPVASNVELLFDVNFFLIYYCESYLMKRYVGNELMDEKIQYQIENIFFKKKKNEIFGSEKFNFHTSQTEF